MAIKLIGGIVIAVCFITAVIAYVLLWLVALIAEMSSHRKDNPTKDEWKNT